MGLRDTTGWLELGELIHLIRCLTAVIVLKFKFVTDLAERRQIPILIPGPFVRSRTLMFLLGPVVQALFR